jgi:hypothetical protein
MVLLFGFQEHALNDGEQELREIDDLLFICEWTPMPCLTGP